MSLLLMFVAIRFSCFLMFFKVIITLLLGVFVSLTITQLFLFICRGGASCAILDMFARLLLQLLCCCCCCCNGGALSVVAAAAGASSAVAHTCKMNGSVDTSSSPGIDTFGEQ